MKFKVKMECIYELPDDLLKEFDEDLDPEEVARKHSPYGKEALSQPIFKDMKVAMEPIVE